MMDIQVWVALIAAIASLIISGVNIVITLKENKKTLIVQNIASNRIKWIEQMRILIQEFAIAYIKGERDKLKIIKVKMDVYMRYNDESYNGLYEQIDKCIAEVYSEQGYRELMNEGQEVLGKVWKRMKLETGMGRRDDSKIRKEIFNR